MQEIFMELVSMVPKFIGFNVFFAVKQRNSDSS